MNTKKSGNIGVAKAILYYTELGYSISIPISESQRYDLIIDKNGTLYRVECKRSTHEIASGNHQVSLKTCGGNQSFSTVKKFSALDADLVFIVTPNGTWEFPSELLDGRATISPDHKKYENYKLASAAELEDCTGL